MQNLLEKGYYMKTLSRRSFLKKSALYGVTLLTSLAGGKYYMEEVEPNWIDINQYTFSHPLIPPSFNQTRIVQFNDTHIGFQYDLSNLEKTVKIIEDLSPDLICFAGDLLDHPNEYKIPTELYEILSSLTAPLGKYAVYGNHDHGGYGTELYENIMVRCHFKVLRNRSNILEMNGERILIAGVDDSSLGVPDIARALQGKPQNLFTLLLSHAPDYAIAASSYPVHLQISGHSHGGQVQIPFIGPLITPPHAKKYYEGLYEINERFSLYVNRGLGTTRIPYRLLCRPEITVFDLYQGEEGMLPSS